VHAKKSHGPVDVTNGGADTVSWLHVDFPTSRKNPLIETAKLQVSKEKDWYLNGVKVDPLIKNHPTAHSSECPVALCEVMEKDGEFERLLWKHL